MAKVVIVETKFVTRVSPEGHRLSKNEHTGRFDLHHNNALVLSSHNLSDLFRNSEGEKIELNLKTEEEWKAEELKKESEKAIGALEAQMG